VRSCRLFPRSAQVRRFASKRWEKTTVVAVKIKLKRLGKIREPYYRIVVADARTKRDGRAIEEIGKYHPKADPSFIEVNSERVQHWLSVGAQPTDPVRVLLKITGDWQKFTGEPGAEGTLKTAAPKADKKEAFTAAAKESLARKEAKEDKGAKGSARSSKPAKDTAPKDTAPKDTAPKDTAPKDTAPKDTAAKDTAAKDSAAKDTAANDSAKDTAAKDSAAKDSAAKEPVAEEPAAKEPVAEAAVKAAEEPAAEADAKAEETVTADAESASEA
jgi:small subunit ribosomal protein S16